MKLHLPAARLHDRHGRGHRHGHGRGCRRRADAAAAGHRDRRPGGVSVDDAVRRPGRRQRVHQRRAVDDHFFDDRPRRRRRGAQTRGIDRHDALLASGTRACRRARATRRAACRRCTPASSCHPRRRSAPPPRVVRRPSATLVQFLSRDAIDAAIRRAPEVAAIVGQDAKQSVVEEWARRLDTRDTAVLHAAQAAALRRHPEAAVGDRRTAR